MSLPKYALREARNCVVTSPSASVDLNFSYKLYKKIIFSALLNFEISPCGILPALDFYENVLICSKISYMCELFPKFYVGYTR